MEHNSPSSKVWKKFKRNKLALSGLLLIAFFIILGILGYLITPDKSPMANTMHLQLSNRNQDVRSIFWSSAEILR
jgi:oligopeptide transport system permease protein